MPAPPRSPTPPMTSGRESMALRTFGATWTAFPLFIADSATTLCCGLTGCLALLLTRWRAKSGAALLVHLKLPEGDAVQCASRRASRLLSAFVNANGPDDEALLISAKRMASGLLENRVLRCWKHLCYAPSSGQPRRTQPARRPLCPTRDSRPQPLSSLGPPRMCFIGTPNCLWMNAARFCARLRALGFGLLSSLRATANCLGNP